MKQLTREQLLEVLYTYTLGFVSERYGESFPGDHEGLDHMFALLWQLEQAGGLSVTFNEALSAIDVPAYMKAYYYDE